MIHRAPSYHVALAGPRCVELEAGVRTSLRRAGYEISLVIRFRHTSKRRLQHRPHSLDAPLGLTTGGVADARELPFPGACADAVLLLGPLYHLIEACECALALAEARRVLRDAGDHK